MLNPDFKDILSAFIEEKVEFLVVGAYAMAFHGYVRATGDIDLWIGRSEENTERVWRALNNFGSPLFDLSKEDLLKPEMVFQIGIVPNRIDILCGITGVEFGIAWKSHKSVEIEGMQIPIIDKEHLLINKRATGRKKDLNDALWLESE